MLDWLSDFRLSLRLIFKSPGFSVASIAVLALGIGLNAAMFSLVYALAYMGRPFVEPERLVQVYSSQAAEPDSYRAFSYPAYEQLAAQGSLFDGVLAHSPTIVGIGEGRESRRAFAVVVSGNYFKVLGVPLSRGREFTDQESKPGQDIPVVIAGWSYWKRTGFRPDLVGSTVRVNERAFTVVGITPRGFTGTMAVFGPEFFFPFGVFHSISYDFQGDARKTLTRADAYNLLVVARLKPDIEMSTADAALEGFAGGLSRTLPAEYKDARVTVGPLRRIGSSTSPAGEGVLGLLGLLLMSLTGAVLLTVCLNLASMLLARGTARRKEFALRQAMGGTRWRIIRQLLTEGFLLALVGGALGLALALWSNRALVGAVTTASPITIALEGAVSPALAAATLLFSMIATAAFALAPALRLSRPNLSSDLKLQSGDFVSRRRGRWRPRNTLVTAQVALSLALLVAAGLFVQMARSATAIDFGFRADGTVLAEVDTSLAGLSTPPSIELYQRLERLLAAQPGVRSASVGALVPLGMVNINRSVKRAGITVPAGANPQKPEEGRAYSTPWNAVSGSYFDAMGVSLLRGRTFSESESFGLGGRPVVIVDEALARKLWPSGDALGQYVEWAARDEDGTKKHPGPLEVVGIVSSTHRDLFDKEMPGAIFVPFAQGALGNAYLHVRPHEPTMSLVDVVRREIRAEAPGLPLFSVRSYQAHIESSAEYWMLRLASFLFAVFSAFALSIAALGIYGVMSHAVSRRTREIGVRMALGAMPASVAKMILAESLSITLAGVAVGLLLGAGVGRMMAAVFVDVAAFDLAVFSSVPALLVAAGLLAAWLPARRATRVSPMTALRAE